MNPISPLAPGVSATQTPEGTTSPAPLGEGRAGDSNQAAAEQLLAVVEEFHAEPWSFWVPRSELVAARSEVLRLQELYRIQQHRADNAQIRAGKHKAKQRRLAKRLAEVRKRVDDYCENYSRLPLLALIDRPFKEDE